MSSKKHVMLAFPLGHNHMIQVAAGVQKYARDHGGWRLTVASETTEVSLKGFRDWPGDGVISLLRKPSQVRHAKEIGLPVVNVSGAMRDTGIPQVTDDQLAIGRLAAEHLLDRGFRRFGFYGLRRVWFSEQRARGFIEHIEQNGGTCSVLETPGSRSHQWLWNDWTQPLEEWLCSLEPPVGIMAVLDLRATIVVDACHHIGLHVPDDVAVIGVNNTPSICELCHPSTSSVSRNGFLTGYEAAKLLHKLMLGKRPSLCEIPITPDGIVKRASTDVIAVDDPHVAAAVQFVRQHIDEPFGVERLMKVVPVSRRWLEHRFRECLGHTPHEFICRSRIERAKQMLIDPQRPKLKQIAADCGLGDSTRLRDVFLRMTGMTPAQFRKVHQDRS